MARVSVLTSLYNSAPYIEEFYTRCLAAIESLGLDYEFVFVDDGSPDDGNALVHDLIKRDSQVRLVELSRNFGHHKAIMAGLEHVQGDLVFMLDSDLEEEPELLETFHRIMDEGENIDVVYGVMEQRKGSLFERLSGAVFYKLINFLSDLPIPENAMAARLMRRRYVDELVAYQETQLYLGGVMMLAGFHQVGVPMQKTSKGRSSYTFARRYTLALDALLSYTNKPLTFIAFFGIAVLLVSMGMGAYCINLASGEAEGWMWVLASVWLLGGLTICSIGLVGFYIGRIFIQVKGRPNTVVKKIYPE